MQAKFFSVIVPNQDTFDSDRFKDGFDNGFSDGLIMTIKHGIPPHTPGQCLRINNVMDSIDDKPDDEINEGDLGYKMGMELAFMSANQFDWKAHDQTRAASSLAIVSFQPIPPMSNN